MSRGRTTALVDPPPWMWGGQPERSFASARLRLRKNGDGTFSIQTEEGYLRRPRPLLVDDTVILDRHGKRGTGYHALAGFVDDEVESSVIEGVRRKGLPDLRPTGHPILDLTSRAQLDLTTCTGSELPSACELVNAALRSVVYDDSGEEVLAHSSVLAIRRDPAIVHRVKIMSVLIRVERDPDLAAGVTSHVISEHAAGRATFGSSESLHDAIYIFDAYVAPLLGALSPAVWAFPVHRVHGTLIVSYGRPIAGTSGTPRDLLHTLYHASGTSGPPAYGPFSNADAPAFATSWWAARLDSIFGVITDPAVFARANGHVDPIVALQALLTVEQLFRRVCSIQLAHDDTHARRVVFFSAMDTIRTLSGVPFNTLFDHTYAAKILGRLERSLPEGAHEVLVPSARAGLEALQRVEEGFFLREGADAVRLDQQGSPVALNVAGAQYLGALRDATHGFSTTRTGAQKRRLSSLLATHTGRLSHDLGFLAWLYFLDFLDSPDRLRRVLGTWAQ